MLRRNSAINLFLLLAFTLLGFAVMGYHPGIEDDGIYLAAVKSNLNPALFPYNSEFFQLQLQASIFEQWVAGFVRLTHISLGMTEMLLQLATLALTLFACWRITCQLFTEARAQWAGVALLAAMFTLPVSGTAIYLADQHLHARNVATALVLAAIWRIVDGRRWQAVPLLLLAFVMHPIMAAMGISLCFFLTLAYSEPVHAWLGSLSASRSSTAVTAVAPLGWVFEPQSPAWKKALDTRTYYYLYKWHWYEWLGALAPLFLFWLLWRWAEKRGDRMLARFGLAVFAFGVFQQAVAMLMLAFPSLVRLTPLQPMRYLHVVYLFMVLIAGALMGKYLLKSSVWRWAAFLLIFNGSMFASQRIEFNSSPHIEWPGRAPSNPWIQAFDWIRDNTPTDAYFALDPRYLAAPGEDYHGFRALAERSQLADAIKDAAVVTQVPELGPEWDRQVEAQRGWSDFKLADFERLKKMFGVNWVLVKYPAPAGLACPWHNDELTACKIP
ncbi:MAG: hypothetical protein P4L40_19505 [Terracidiphilus sp.]|nr:hypothetical protein [Terracidiphilus sp.]